MQETTLIFFNLEERLPKNLGLISHYESELSFLTHSFQDVLDVNESILMSSKSIIIGKVEDKKDLVSIIKILKRNRLKLKYGSLKVSVFNLTNNKKVEKLLSSYGCHEYLTTEMNLKTICFKIDFWARTLKNDEKVTKQERQKEKVFSSKKEDLGGFYKGVLKKNDTPLKKNKQNPSLGEKELSVEELTQSGDIHIITKQVIDGVEKVYKCQLEDLFGTELILLFKKDFVFELSPVKIDISFHYLNESVSIESIYGQVIEIESHDDEKQLAVIDLLEVPEMDFKRLLKLYSKRQNAISEFMTRAKGY